ncbi:MAG TPA: TPM domain-containing protein [Candidatus Bathyarchaeia archaeon]|nr:TPM domain-containing protein [Candidatus Bathyarchaeia archaeon]
MANWRRKILSLVGIIFLFSLAGTVPLLAVEFPQPAGFVNDWAGIFSTQFISSLENQLVSFEKETTVEFSVVTVGDLQETTIEDLAVRLFEEWRIGKKEKDNGLLLLVAPNQRQVRIEVGYGLEGVVTDGRAGRIIREKIIPEFKDGHYEAGVSSGVDSLLSYVRSGETPTAAEEIQTKAAGYINIIVIAVIILVYFSSFWGRSRRIWPGGITGGILGLTAGWIIGILAWVIILALAFFLFGLLLDWLLSRNYDKLKSSGRSTSWWPSRGGFFSGGGGGGGFGGFGGGSSGGGGASGSW